MKLLISLFGFALGCQVASLFAYIAAAQTEQHTANLVGFTGLGVGVFVWIAATAWGWRNVV